jgi:hypothetical protein
VTHPSGEVSTRRTDADYSHAVVAVGRRTDEITRLSKLSELLEAEGHRYAKNYRKALAKLASFDHPMTYRTVSFHTRRDLAEKKANRKATWAVVEVDREGV